MAENPKQTELVTGRGVLQIASHRAEVELTVPAETVCPTRVLPVFQALTDRVMPRELFAHLTGQ